jgi:hypothetical protein
MLARVADLPTACSPIKTVERVPQDQEHWRFASELRNWPLASVTGRAHLLRVEAREPTSCLAAAYLLASLGRPRTCDRWIMSPFPVVQGDGWWHARSSGWVCRPAGVLLSGGVASGGMSNGRTNRSPSTASQQGAEAIVISPRMAHALRVRRQRPGEQQPGVRGDTSVRHPRGTRPDSRGVRLMRRSPVYGCSGLARARRMSSLIRGRSAGGT